MKAEEHLHKPRARSPLCSYVLKEQSGFVLKEQSGIFLKDQSGFVLKKQSGFSTLLLLEDGGRIASPESVSIHRKCIKL